MDLKRWTHIVAVADRRSFVRAAEQVHLSQPALTPQHPGRRSRARDCACSTAARRRWCRRRAGEFVVARARQLVFNSRCLERDVELYRNRGLGDTAFGVGPFPAATFLPPLLAGDAARVSGHQPAGRGQQLAAAAEAPARGRHRVLRRRHARPAVDPATAGPRVAPASRAASTCAPTTRLRAAARSRWSSCGRTASPRCGCRRRARGAGAPARPRRRRRNSRWRSNATTSRC